MNLSTHRIWCYLCENEVFLSQRNNVNNHHGGFGAESEIQSADSTDDEERDEMDYTRGEN